MSGPAFLYSGSLGTRVLWQMAVRIAVVIALITAASYWNIHRSMTKAGLNTLKEYVRERGERESQLFLLAEDNLQTLMRRFMAERSKLPAASVDQAFAAALERNPDGAWRRREGFDVENEPSAYIAARVKIDAAVRHEVMAALNLTTSFGHAWQNRFASLFLTSFDGYGITYVPGVNWDKDQPPDVDYLTRPWVQPVLPANDPERTRRWTGIWYDDASHIFAATCILPQDVDGRFKYYAGTSILLDDIMRRTREVSLAGTYNVLFRADGQLISHPDDAIMAELRAGKGKYSISTSGDEHLKALYETVINARDRDILSLDTYDEFLGVTRIAGPDWYFVTVMPKRVLASAAASTARIVLWLGLGALLLELAVVGWILRRRVTEPLRHFLEKVTAFGRGDLESRISVAGQDELAMLGRAFNRMAQTIGEHQRQLTTHAEGLEAKVAERTRQLEEKNHAKTQFLAAASHDLRQPAQAQGLFLDVLSRTALDDQQRQLLDNLSASYQSSNNMLNSLLEYSQIEAGVVKSKPRDFALQPLLHKIEREFGPLANAKGLYYRCRDTKLIAHSDPVLLERILRNLVSNAIRYTEQGGVLVAARRRHDDVWLEVWDTGIGIAPENQKAVFLEFLQLDNPERDRQKGLGLGLAIVEGLVQHLGHGLTLRSRSGRGSLFRLVLPSGIGGQITAPTVPAPEPLLRDARILVIDDDPSIRAALRYLLTDWGCRCDVVETVEEALDIARQAPLDMVISDYRLRDEVTGSQAIAALRALLGRPLPALLITGDTAPERLRDAHASGISLLHKPVKPNELRKQLAALLAVDPSGHVTAPSLL